MRHSITQVYSVDAHDRAHARFVLAQALHGRDTTGVKLEFESVRAVPWEAAGDDQQRGWRADVKAAIRDLLLGPKVATQQPARRRQA